MFFAIVKTATLTIMQLILNWKVRNSHKCLVFYSDGFRFVGMSIKILTFAAAALLIFGCKSNEQVNQEEQTSSEVVEQENPEPVDSKKLLLGSWYHTSDVNGTQFEVQLTLNEDGTYIQSMSGTPMNGTWEVLDDEHIVVKSEFIRNPEGQKWQIVKSTSDELHINWNVDKGDPMIMEFKRSA